MGQRTMRSASPLLVALAGMLWLSAVALVVPPPEPLLTRQAVADD